MKKKLLSWILIFSMIVTLFPETAFAATNPAFGFRCPGRDETTESHFEDPDASLEYSFDVTCSSGQPAFFYFVDENGAETRLSVEDLSSSNEAIVTFSDNQECPGMLDLNFKEPGNAKINYTHNDTVYSIPVNVDLPMVGFYSAPSATAENFVSEFTITADNDTIYLVTRFGIKITSVTLSENFEAIAEVVSIDESEEFATIKITGTPSNQYYELYCGLTDPESGDSGNEWMAVSLRNSKPSLMFRWPDWNDGPVENTESHLNNHFQNAIGDTNDLFFYFTEGDSETKLSASDLTSSDETVVKISPSDEHPDCVFVELVGFGEASINYTVEDVTYSLPVSSTLPAIGFYSSLEATEETYINEFKVTDENDTFYLIARDFWTITRLEPNDNLSEIATITLDESGTFATIEVTGDVNPNYGYEVRFDAANYEYDNYWENNCKGINLRSGKPSLMFRWPDWNDGVLTENTENHLSNHYQNSIGDTNNLFFYFTDGDNETKLSVSDLISSDENVVKISSDEEYPDSVYVELVGFGEATIDYKVDDVTYSLSVACTLPAIGFYSSLEATEETYITEFKVTDENDTFYLIARDFWTITRLDAHDNLSEIATITLDESGTFATITITGTVNPDYNYSVRYDALNEEYDNFMDDNGRSIQLHNGKPALMFRWPDWNNGVPTENTEHSLSNSYNNSLGRNSLFFYFTEGEDETKLSVSDLTSSDETVVKISEDSDNANAVCLEAVGFGTATIDYVVDETTYSVNINIQLPFVGLYSTPEASTETYIREFSVTDDSDTFYLVARDGWELTNVSLDDDLTKIATYTLNDDNTYAAIEVFDTPEHDQWYTVSYSAFNSRNDNSMNDNSFGIKLKNGKPSLMLREADWDNGPVENKNYWIRPSFEMVSGYDNTVFFYYVKDGKETMLNVSDLTSSDETIVKMKGHNQNENAVVLTAGKFGTATIHYTIDTVTYSLDVTVGLPRFGFYTTPYASEETYIREFTVTNTEDTFYLVANNGWKMSEIYFDEMLSNIASYTLDESDTFAKIQVTGTVESDRWYEVGIQRYNEEDSGRSNTSIRLLNGKPTLQCAWPDEDMFLYTACSASKGEERTFNFYLVNGDTKTLVSPSDLVSSDETIVQISETEEHYANLKFVDWGETTITYTDEDDNTYSFRVFSRLPIYGFYTQPFADTACWMDGKFELTDTENTLYFISRDDFTFDNFTADENLEAIADVSLSDDRTVIQITITGEPEENVWYGIQYTSSNSNGSASEGSRGFQIVNNKTPEEQPPVNPPHQFTDVKKDSWYASAVDYVYENGIMTGTSEKTFEPGKKVSRAVIVTTLYKLAGNPEVDESFDPTTMIKDYKANTWWSDALKWALSVGVATGNTSTNKFEPSKQVTRQELATFLERYSRLVEGKQVEISTETTALIESLNVPNWAKPGFAFALETGIITGITNGTSVDYSPKGTTSRAQLATMIHRFSKI